MGALEAGLEVAAGLEGVLALAHPRVTQGSSLARMLGCASLQSQQDMENPDQACVRIQPAHPVCPHSCPLVCLAKDSCTAPTAQCTIRALILSHI